MLPAYPSGLFYACASTVRQGALANRGCLPRTHDRDALTDKPARELSAVSQEQGSKVIGRLVHDTDALEIEADLKGAVVLKRMAEAGGITPWLVLWLDDS